ncbi:MAG: hypothetical protein HY560_10900 [Gemmatimonadetes bacterium]|nr:hypothetical protein [Gemmatimonadota bacterium]
MRSFAMVLVAVLLRVSVAAGQGELGVSYGVYFPFGGNPLVKEFGGVGGGPVPYPVLEKWQNGAPALILRPAYWFSSRFGIEAGVGSALGKVSTRDSLNTVIDQAAYLLMLSARSPVRFNPPTANVVLHLSPGVAALKRGGNAWAGYQGTTDPAAVVGFGARGLLRRRSHLWFRLEIETYISRAQFVHARYNPTARRLHHDTIFSLGLVYSFKRPPATSPTR